ncbi:MAG: ThiF family adenylyltransferase [Alphaproteobacteria bacterium]
MAPRAKPAPDEISDAQLLRYARHVVLDEIGEEGQARLLSARVLVVGAGGLGSPLLLYLAAAGVGSLRVVDDDTVDLTNLQRQIIHTTSRIGARKADSARESILALNPEVRVEAHAVHLTEENIASLVAGCDVVADGTDNFAARFILSDACARARVPLVSAALQRFEGQITTFRPWLGGPCYRCLFPEPPPEDLIPRCEEAGILGAVAGVLGTLQATEVIKEILALGESLDGTLLFYDALAASFQRITVRKNPDCPVCGMTAR